MFTPAMIDVLCGLVADVPYKVWVGTRFDAAAVSAFAVDQESGTADYAMFATAKNPDGVVAWQVVGTRKPTTPGKYDKAFRPSTVEMVVRSAAGRAFEVRLSERWSAAIARSRGAE